MYKTRLNLSYYAYRACVKKNIGFVKKMLSNLKISIANIFPTTFLNTFSIKTVEIITLINLCEVSMYT